jgi:teichuronic acid biosynthesis glycosyltransferase TuaC
VNPLNVVNSGRAAKTLVFSEEYVRITKGMFRVWLNHVREMSKTRSVDILLNREHWALEEAQAAFFANPRVVARQLPFGMPSTLVTRLIPADGQSGAWRAARFALGEILNLLFAPLVICYLWLLLRRTRPMVVFSHAGGWPAAPLCRWIIYAAALARVPKRILIIHNYPMMRSRLPWNLLAAPLRLLRARSIAGSATSVVTVSDSVRMSLESRVFKSPVVRIYNGIPLSPLVSGTSAHHGDFGWHPEGSVVGFVGALYPLKGPHVLLDAFRLVDVPCELALLGPADPEYLKDLRDRARLCANKVSFLGFQDDVDSFMERIDLLVVPSIAFESFGMVILEAMKHRKSVICSDFGGRKEVVENGVTGLVVRAGDALALSRAIITLLADAEARRQMGEAGYRRLSELFTAEKMVDQYDRLVFGH